MDKAAATSNPHEADAFSSKAAELVARYRLDPIDVRRADRVGGPGADALSLRDVELGRGAYVRARLALLTAVGEANDVRIVFTTGPTGMIAHLAGYSSDLDVVELMYHSLHQQVTSQLVGIRRATPAATQRFRRSFLFGYAERIGALLEQSRRDVEAQADAEPGSPAGGTGLMRRARIEAVDEYMATAFPRVRTARAPGAAQAGGWTAGAAAADRADVGRARLQARPAIGRG